MHHPTDRIAHTTAFDTPVVMWSKNDPCQSATVFFILIISDINVINNKICCLHHPINKCFVVENMIVIIIIISTFFFCVFYII